MQGENRYDVAVYFNDDLMVDDYECDCLAYYEYEGACKHIVALMKVVQEYWDHYFPAGTVLKLARRDKPPAQVQAPALKSDPASIGLMNWFEQSQSFSAQPAENRAANTMLIPTFYAYTSGSLKQHRLEFQLGSSRLYVMKDIPEFIKAYLNQRDLEC